MVAQHVLPSTVTPIRGVKTSARTCAKCGAKPEVNRYTGGLGLTAFREVVASGVIPQQRHPEHNAVRVRRADVEAYRAAMSRGAVRAEGSR